MGLIRSWVAGRVRSSKVLIGPEPGVEGSGPGAAFGGLDGTERPDGLDGLDSGHVGRATVVEEPPSPGDDPVELSGSAGAAIAPGAAADGAVIVGVVIEGVVIVGAGPADTGIGGPMITGLELLTAIGPDGGAITAETGAPEAHDPQPGLAAP